MNRFIYILLLTVFININPVAAADPMVSLFKFQSQMAEAGNADAMMKMGEMYEQGVGTKQDLNKALDMYKQAQSKGQKEAANAIRRIEEIKKKGVRNLELERQKKMKKERALREQKARDKIAKEKAVKDKAVREKAAKEKAAKEKAAREKFARDKAAREKLAKDKAARDKTAKAKKAKEKAVRSQAEREKLAREKALRDYEARRQKAAGEKPNEVKAAPVVKEKTEQVNINQDDSDDEDDDGFASDPCDSPAARFMANCRKN